MAWDRERKRQWGREYKARNRESLRQYQREYKARNREKVRRSQTQMRRARRDYLHTYLLSHPCIDCGEADLRVLDFDHRDGTEKRGDISEGVRSWAFDKLHAEIEKCDVRCANCHRKRTAEQLGWHSHAAMTGEEVTYFTKRDVRPEPVFRSPQLSLLEF